MSGADCQRWVALSDQVAVGEMVSDHDQAWLVHHAQGCDECSREATFYTSLRAAVGRPELLVVPARTAAPAKPRLPTRRTVVVAMALAAGIALALGLAGSREPVGANPSLALQSPVTARLLFHSGDASVGTAPAEAGRMLVAGERLGTGDGRACVAVADSITVCLDAHSAATLSLADPNKVLVYLERGRVLARLDRQPAGRTFAVRTAQSEVEAVGTRFSVGITGEGRTQVRLHEGKVAVRAANHMATDLVAPAQASVGDGIHLAPLPQPSGEDALLSDLSALPRTPAGTVVRLDSAPAGADVLINNVAMGKTPLTAVLASDAHVRVSMAGYAPVREWLSVAGAPAIARTFNLTALPAPLEPPAKAHGPRTSPELLPGQLLAKAQALRARGEYDACARLYHRLWSEHPASEEAKVSMVSLGELELGKRGRPAAALEAFGAYLRAGGPLEREARFGRIRALRALGRDGEADRDSAAFLRDYPRSVQAAALGRTP